MNFYTQEQYKDRLRKLAEYYNAFVTVREKAGEWNENVALDWQNGAINMAGDVNYVNYYYMRAGEVMQLIKTFINTWKPKLKDMHPGSELGNTFMMRCDLMDSTSEKALDMIYKYMTPLLN